MSEAVVSVEGLFKSFGATRAVDEVSFRAEPGEVFGLLGPNGAGKTTTLRILATLLRPDRGVASVAGFEVQRHPEEVRRSVGVVNGGMGLYERLSGREILQSFGGLYDLGRRRIEARIEELDALLNLSATLDRRAGAYSTGMAQKIVIARAVLHDPPVLLFDEATSGLDVMARRAVLDFCAAYPRPADGGSPGRVVLYSTHVMSEVERLCQRVAILHQGRVVALDSVSALLARSESDALEDAFFKLIPQQDVVGGPTLRPTGAPVRS